MRPVSLLPLLLLVAAPTLAAEIVDPLAPWRADEAVPVLPGLVSTEAAEFALSLTPDARRLYFTRRVDDDGQRLVILESRFVDGAWSAPETASFSGTWDDADPYVSPDGAWLYFMSKRPTGDDGPREDFELWSVAVEGDGFGEPRWLDAVGSAAGDSYPTVSAAGELVFASRRDGGEGGNDLWLASPAGDGFAAPTWLGAEINSERSDGNPLIAPDGSWLIFFASTEQRAPDLVLSRRADDGGFAAPEPLCPEVSTDAAEFAPGLSPDGSVLFFSRDGDIFAIASTACGIPTR